MDLPTEIIESIAKAIDLTVDELPPHGTVIFTANADGSQTIQVHEHEEPEIWSKPPSMTRFFKMQFPNITK